MASNIIAPRAFGVWWKDLHRWGVKSFQSSQWQWPPSAIKKLTSALERRCEPVDKTSFKLRPEHFVSLRFTGEVEQRDLHGKNEFKGALFFARAGDIIYSKIDVRNGAIGIVPAEVPIATVTSEFPVYRIKKDVTLSEYVQLVFRTEHFRRIINGMVSGTSGRKRVQPDDLENVEIPLPTLAEQKAIVARWRKAQDEIAAARGRSEILQCELQKQTRKALGIAEKNGVRLPKIFALQWRELARWSVEFLGRQVVGLAGTETGKYPAHSLSSVCQGVSGGTPPTRNEAYWDGKIPWVSPKDMKTPELFDAQDHVSQMAVDEVVPLVPANSVLIVVRSGILQRTVPIAVNRVPVSINQDIRAFIPRSSQQVLPGFLAAYLEAQQQNLLHLVKWSTTVQSINKEELEAFPVPLPPLAVQNKIVADVSARKKEIAREREAAEKLAKKISAEVEALILGTKPLEEK